jgi:Nucleotide modification associated domain 2
MPDRYCFYRMTDDAGSAPNPFYGRCTLAICTPNHQRARLSKGDVIVGVEADPLIRRRRKNQPDSTSVRCIVYYTVIDEILDLDSYFRDRRLRGRYRTPADRSLPPVATTATTRTVTVAGAVSPAIPMNTIKGRFFRTRKETVYSSAGSSTISVTRPSSFRKK